MLVSWAVIIRFLVAYLGRPRPEALLRARIAGVTCAGGLRVPRDNASPGPTP